MPRAGSARVEEGPGVGPPSLKLLRREGLWSGRNSLPAWVCRAWGLQRQVVGLGVWNVLC